MKIESEWIKDAQLQTVLSLLNSGDDCGYLVGGCVRNALMQIPTTDIDIATSLDPNIVSNKAQNADFKVIPTGLDHGTVTVVTDAGPLEITTFRQDVETDGRHASVAFTTDIHQDAARRDFTMNALYADATGQVIDPLGGIADLQNGHVRFIGDPEARIKEDYLRILRFFRFTAIYGNPALGIDADGLAACAQHQSGLEHVSKERIGSEMLKLLGAHDPSKAVASMFQSNVLQQVLKGADPKYLSILVHLENGFPIDPIRRLAILGGASVPEDLRLSKKQKHALTVLQNAQDPSGKRTAYEHGFEMGLGAALIAYSYSESPVHAGLETNLKNAASATFPVSSSDLTQFVSGPDLGKAISMLKHQWIRTDFLATKTELLAFFHTAQTEGRNGD